MDNMPDFTYDIEGFHVVTMQAPRDTTRSQVRNVANLMSSTGAATENASIIYRIRLWTHVLCST